MQCRTPLHLRISDYDRPGEISDVYIPCGKPTCYACSCASRGEWVVRCQYEHEDRPSAFFITLTYTNQALLDEGLVLMPRNKQKSYIYSIEVLPPKARKWDNCIFNIEHLRTCIADMQQYIKKFWHSELYDDVTYIDKKGKKRVKSLVKPFYFGDNLCRVYATSEYGTISHRPHFHMLVFFPIKLHRSNVVGMFQTLWKYGRVDVGRDFRTEGINYVAKHQVKSCNGSPVQRKFCPIRRIVSRCYGGLGRSMYLDESLYNDYIHTREVYDPLTKCTYTEFDHRYIEVPGHKLQYKVAMPRFVTRRFRVRYVHEQGRDDWQLSTSELRDLSKKSTEKFLRDFNLFINFRPDLKDKPLDEQISLYYVNAFNADYQQRKEYELKRYKEYISNLDKKLFNRKKVSTDEFV